MKKIIFVLLVGATSYGQQWNGSTGPTGTIDRDGDVEITGELRIDGADVNLDDDYTTSIGWTTADRITGLTESQTVANYGLTLNKFVTGAVPPTLSISGFGGLRFFTGGTEKMRMDDYGKVGIGVTSPTSILHVNGDITALAVKGPSDIRFKKNIRPLENALSKTAKLRGYSYEWKNEEFPDRNFKTGKDIGLIAQEVEEVYPEVVFTADDAMKSKSIDYAKLVAVLVESIKELKAEVDYLKSQLDPKQ